MKHKSGLRKKKSLCEKSMVLVANIIKLSSVSLGKINLGTTSSSTTTTTRIRSVQAEAANSGHTTTNAAINSNRTSATKFLLDIEVIEPPPQHPRINQKKKPEQFPAASVLSEPTKANNGNIPRGFTTTSSATVKRDHHHQVLADDVNDRAEKFIRRKRQIINDEAHVTS